MSEGRSAATKSLSGLLVESTQFALILPWVILAALAVAAAAALSAMDALIAVEVNDTESYASHGFGSIQEALGGRRTPGYPLLLWGVRSLTGSYAAVPVAHLLLYCGGVALFLAGILAHRCPRLASPWIAGSLFSGYILGRYVGTLATDTSAAALGVGSVGALLMATSGRPRAWRWYVVVALMVTAAWLVRPTMASLVPFVAIAGPLLMLHRKGGDVTYRQLARCGALCLAITLIPLLAWCGLRWWTVGKFGIVSYGGYNLIGIAGQFVDEEVAERLPETLRPLAMSGLRRRAELSPDQALLRNAPALSYSRMEQLYDVTIWEEFAPAAVSHYGNDPTLVNSKLRELGTAVIRHRPREYAIWLAKAGRQALRVSSQELVSNPVSGSLILLTLLATIVIVVQSWRRPELVDPRPWDPRGIIGLLFLLSVLYASLNLLLVIVVCPPLGRMTDAACVLFPALIAAIFVDRVAALARMNAAARRAR